MDTGIDSPLIMQLTHLYGKRSMLTFIITEGHAFSSFLLTRWDQIGIGICSTVVKQDGASTLECALLGSDALRNRMGLASRRFPSQCALLHSSSITTAGVIINENGKQAQACLHNNNQPWCPTPPTISTALKI